MRKAAAMVAAALACATLAVAGCGGMGGGMGGGASGGAGGGGAYAAAYRPDGSATIAAGQTLTVELGTMYFQPNTLTVAQGTAVTLLLKNASGIRHNFSLDAFHVSQNVAPGQSATVSFTADQAGTFYFYCDVPGHARAGMVGRLTVQ